jgi:shikimate dehydrogenase
LARRTRLGVLGWPVAHSRSPQMQNAALRAAGLTGWRYQLLPIAPELFAETARALPAAGFRGANVTIPHKQAAAWLADSSSDSAGAIGAANTLVFEDSGEIYADNTDAPGLIAALPFSPRRRTALVLGAGGSARAAVWALLTEGAAEVRVWNRDPARARRLCDEIGGTPVLEAAPADLLVNCTPVGLNVKDGDFKDLPLGADETAMFACVVDLAYSHAETPLVRSAKTFGVAVVDGLDVLICQGALSFERFTGRAAPIREMRAAVHSR